MYAALLYMRLTKDFFSCYTAESACNIFKIFKNTNNNHALDSVHTKKKDEPCGFGYGKIISSLFLSKCVYVSNTRRTKLGFDG